VAKVGTSKAGGTISQQAVVHPWLAADAHVNKQTRVYHHQHVLVIYSDDDRDGNSNMMVMNRT
jgi:hypothetical protein